MIDCPALGMAKLGLGQTWIWPKLGLAPQFGHVGVVAVCSEKILPLTLSGLERIGLAPNSHAAVSGSLCTCGAQETDGVVAGAFPLAWAMLLILWLGESILPFKVCSFFRYKFHSQS